MNTKDDRPPTAADLRWRAEEIARDKAALSPDIIESLPPESLRQMLHELQVHQIELELQTNELRKANENLRFEIDDRIKVEQALMESVQRHQTILQTAMDGFWMIDLQGRLLEVNEAYCRMSGFSAPELLNMRISDLEAVEALEDTVKHLQMVLTQGQDRFTSRHRRKDGSLFDVEITVQHRPAENCFVAFLRDVTERKQAESAMQDSLREKESLLKEIHHRVKNNLQIVSSLLRLQSRQIEHPATKTALQDMQNRVRSMALVHEYLYRSENLAHVDLAAYLKSLCRELVRALVAHPSLIRLRIDVVPIRLGIDQSVPCGLLVNELVSNALKHGFPDGREGEVRIELQTVPGGPELRLRVADNGVGLPPEFKLDRLTSLGLRLVPDLARQMGGNLKIGTGPGAVFDVVFTPEIETGQPSSSMA